MKISTAALSLIAVLSQPNGGRSEDFLRGGDSTVALTSDAGGHDSASAREKKENPSPVPREKKDDGKLPVELENAPPGCVVKHPEYIGNGFCNWMASISSGSGYNTEACDYDGGDCCESNCTDADFSCGSGWYHCIDPSADENDPSTLSPGCNVTYPSFIGDGFCNENGNYNTEACDYDGGDCCISTCKNGAHPERCGSGFYDCKDPYIPSDAPIGCDVLNPEWIGNGRCDNMKSMLCNLSGGCYNTEACDYDGGDCCESTCKDADFSCGSNGYACKDPSGTGCNVKHPEYIGNGRCDGILVVSNDDYDPYNSEACDYDGGDCCESTCKDADFSCGSNGYACKDPSGTTTTIPSSTQGSTTAGTTTDATTTIPPSTQGSTTAGTTADATTTIQASTQGSTTTGTTADTTTTIPASTQGSTTTGTTTDATTAIPPSTQGSTTTGTTTPGEYGLPPGCDVPNGEYLGDGYCDNYDNYNTEACDYDGGDCCCATSVMIPTNVNETSACGINGWACQDMQWACQDPSVPTDERCEIELPPGCNVLEPHFLGDGWCDKIGGYNTEACDYDGGDCCESTCMDDGYGDCGANGYDCKDPYGTTNQSDEYGLPQEEAEVM